VAEGREKVPTKTLKILIASGVNLDLLGAREPLVYGTSTLLQMEKMVKINFARDYKSKTGKNYAGKKQYQLHFFQTNDEAKFLKELDRGYVGAVINAGAWTHTSLAIADRLIGLSLPYVEVHVSDLTARETFRQFSYLAQGAVTVIQGHGIESYWLGVEALVHFLHADLR
jgi:3-dehydroquinate dehydratase II